MIKTITTDFHGANARVCKVSGAKAWLEIVPDAGGGWSQWFNFRLEAEPGCEVLVTITNAGQCTYAEGWEDYRAFVADGEGFVRTETSYAGGVLEIRHVMQTGTAQFAYYPPYDEQRLDTWLGGLPPSIAHDVLGQSAQGRPLHHLRFGTGPVHIWVVARQHSGETMASWWVEGAVAALLSAQARAGELATFHLVPLANPDGAALGHLRASALGQDLNRAWARPGGDAPEVEAIRRKIEMMGANMVLDVHGDELSRCIFLDGAGPEHRPDDDQQAVYRALADGLAARCPAFDPSVSYPDDYGGADGSGMLARTAWRDFGAVGVTLEMPFHAAGAGEEDGAAFARSVGEATMMSLLDLLETGSLRPR